MTNKTKPTIFSITGADDKTNIQMLEMISKTKPHVEWGVLLFPEHEGRPRVPKPEWVDRFLRANLPRKSAHLCGRKIFEDILSIDTEMASIASLALLGTLKLFGKVQLNINSRLEGFNDTQVMLIYNIVHSYLVLDAGCDVTLQYNERSAPIIEGFLNMIAITCGTEYLKRYEILFDTSLGRGTVSESYPAPLVIHGHTFFPKYAGGLNTENISEEHEKIRQVVGHDSYGLDLESGARTDNGFNIVKVLELLNAP